jgi:hypothetical protein
LGSALGVTDVPTEPDQGEKREFVARGNECPRHRPLITPFLENLLRFVRRRLQHIGKLIRVSIHRHTCNESCTYYGQQG